MIRILRFGSRRIVLAGLLIVFAGWGRPAGAQMIGVPTNDAVRGEVMITNTTGLTVNDLEMMVCTKEGTPILGFSGTASGFANTTAVFDPNMPGCVDVRSSSTTTRTRR